MELTYSVFLCMLYFYEYMSRDAYARVLCFLAMTAWLFLPSSRQTQWDPPTWESPGDDASLEHEAEMDLGTPTYDENPMKVSVAYLFPGHLGVFVLSFFSTISHVILEFCFPYCSGE